MDGETRGPLLAGAARAEPIDDYQAFLNNGPLKS